MCRKSRMSLFRQRINLSVCVKQSGEYQFEWNFSVGKLLFKWNVLRAQVCVCVCVRVSTIKAEDRNYPFSTLQEEKAAARRSSSWSPLRTCSCSLRSVCNAPRAPRVTGERWKRGERRLEELCETSHEKSPTAHRSRLRCHVNFPR